jgi:hypothetical protein
MIDFLLVFQIAKCGLSLSFSMQIPYVMVANILFCLIFLPMTKISVESSGQIVKYWFISSEYYIVITFVGMLLTAVCKIPQVTKAFTISNSIYACTHVTQILNVHVKQILDFFMLA